MILTDAHRQQMQSDGYVKLPEIVPRARVEGALRAINHSLGEGVDPAQMSRFRQVSFCPELQREPAITDLVTETPVWGVLEEFLGAGQVQPPASGQVALRFPTIDKQPGPAIPHIDGRHTLPDGSRELCTFTVLLGVFLSDVPTPNAGNLTVWPGVHHALERHARQHGPQALLDYDIKDNLPEPVQLTAKAGDIALVHYLTPHGVAPHVGPHIRYGIFFRICHRDHEQHKWDALTNMWLAWKPKTGSV